MKHLILSTAPLAGTALPAAAHPGHLAGLAGHDHWVAGAAIGAAVAVGVWGALKGRRKKGAATQEPESSDDAARHEG